MLDLDDPMTTHIFAAARAEDYLLEHSKYMTLASAEERQRLLLECQKAIEILRQLNIEHFGGSAFIADAIEDYQLSLNELAGLKTDPLRGNGYAISVCPACGTSLTRIHSAFMPKPEQRWSVYCRLCLDRTASFRRRLESSQGFGTWAI